MNASLSVPLSEVCRQERVSIRPGDQAQLRYIGMESIEAGGGQLAKGDLSKTPEVPEANTFHFTQEHVLYGKLRPYLNKVLAPDFEGKCSTELVPLRVTDKLDRRYLAYFLRAPSTVEAISQKVAGARMPRADMSFVMSLQIPTPPVPEQGRIVELLSRAESIVRMRREAEAKAKEIIPALFVDMFGDPVENPMGLPRVPLGDVSKKITDGEHQNPVFVTDGLPIVMASQVEDWQVNDVEAKQVSNADFAKFTRKCNPESGDLLIVSRGATIGRSCVVTGNHAFCLMGSVILVKPDTERVVGDFLWGQLRHPSFRSVLVATSGSSAQQAIYIAHLRKTPVIVPALREQLRFSRFVGQIRDVLSLFVSATLQAEQAFQSLLAGVFGEGRGI